MDNSKVWTQFFRDSFQRTFGCAAVIVCAHYADRTEWLINGWLAIVHRDGPAYEKLPWESVVRLPAAYPHKTLPCIRRVDGMVARYRWAWEACMRAILDNAHFLAHDAMGQVSRKLELGELYGESKWDHN